MSIQFYPGGVKKLEFISYDYNEHATEDAIHDFAHEPMTL